MSSSPSQKIYFDESGFTGNNLLRSGQTYFAYGSVATSDEEAKEVVTRLIKDFKIQAAELKGSRLVTTGNGRRLVTSLLEHFQGRLKVTVADKHFALASKIFEYVFEPCLAANSTIFYGIRFHLFIANLLYFEFRARGTGAEKLFEEFESIMRSAHGGGDLSALFPSALENSDSDAIRQVVEFAHYNHSTIKDELDGMKGEGVGKWILDLSFTSIWTLLSEWGTEHSSITAVCDNSKPLATMQEFINKMIGRNEQAFTDLFGERQAITFSLAGPVEFGDSKTTHGIQIADVASAAIVYAVTSGDREVNKKWFSLLPSARNIIPDIEALDTSHPDCIRGSILLHELHDRASKQQDLLENIDSLIHRITYASAAIAMQRARKHAQKT